MKKIKNNAKEVKLTFYFYYFFFKSQYNPKYIK